MTSARPKCPIALPAEKPTRFLIPTIDAPSAIIVDLPSRRLMRQHKARASLDDALPVRREVPSPSLRS
jgi:hypothetical protein